MNTPYASGSGSNYGSLPGTPTPVGAAFRGGRGGAIPAPARRGRKPGNAGSTTSSPRSTSPEFKIPAVPGPVPVPMPGVAPGGVWPVTPGVPATPGAPSNAPYPPGFFQNGGSMTQTTAAALQSRLQALGAGAAPAKMEGEEEEGDDELLPAMADDDYSAQASYQTQSKDNLKYVLCLFYSNTIR
jgi:transcription initiation factor TFIID subunit 11